MILTIFGLAFVLPTAIRAIRTEQASDVGHSFRTSATDPAPLGAAPVIAQSSQRKTESLRPRAPSPRTCRLS
ncbi:hypothetical protein BDR22DRAFT_862352 [Usnea florida]